MFRCFVALALFMSLNVFADLVSVADHYKHRYNARSVIKDYISNDNLRNLKRMKVALDGVLYWGGGRYGTSPLGRDAIAGLCEEGFSNAVYVYKAPGHLSGTSCSNGSTDYLNIVYSSRGNYPALEKYLRLVKQTIDNPDNGPVYVHCWNGIHASSQMAAVALRQFCGISSEQAVRVFQENSEGTWKQYSHVSAGIRNFKPYSNLNITPEQRRVVCNTAFNSL